MVIYTASKRRDSLLPMETRSIALTPPAGRNIWIMTRTAVLPHHAPDTERSDELICAEDFKNVMTAWTQTGKGFQWPKATVSHMETVAMPIFLAATVGQQDVLLCLLLVDDADVKSIANIYKTSAFWPSLSLSIHTNQTNHTNYLIIMAYDIFGATIILSSTFICEKLAKKKQQKNSKGSI